MQIKATPKGLSSDEVPVLESLQDNGASIQQFFINKEGQAALVISASKPEMLVEATTAMGDPKRIPAESTEEAAILTTNGNIVLLPLTSEAPIPVKSQLVNKVKGLYEYASTTEGQENDGSHRFCHYGSDRSLYSDTLVEKKTSSRKYGSKTRH